MTSAGVGTARRSGELAVAAVEARRADLTVKVAKRAKEERVFDCWISSPLVPDLVEPQLEEWELAASAGEIVKSCMSEFENPNSAGEDRLLSLKGAGGELWEAAPQGIGRALKLVGDSGQVIESIQIVSDEGSIPWELMLPDDDDERPLGVRYAISRWFTGQDPLRDAGKPAGDARVGVSGNGPPKAQDEAKLVCDLLAGKPLDTSSAKTIEDQLAAWSGTVLHFVCHGGAEELYLDGISPLTARQVAGMRSKLKPGWRGSAPVVFLNACRAGQQVPTLIGPGGLSRSWTKVGAAAVIAPLWGVKDKVAHAVANHFYEQITREPGRPYAEIVRDIRGMAEQRQEDSFAAYSYFGSPWACAR